MLLYALRGYGCVDRGLGLQESVGGNQLAWILRTSRKDLHMEMAIRSRKEYVKFVLTPRPLFWIDIMSCMMAAISLLSTVAMKC